MTAEWLGIDPDRELFLEVQTRWRDSDGSATRTAPTYKRTQFAQATRGVANHPPSAHRDARAEPVAWDAASERRIHTQAFNRRHRRVGHVLQGHFKSIVVEKESHLLELARYVVLNPIRAKIVRSAKDWAWSSYRSTSGMTDAPSFLTVDWILAQFDKNQRRAVEFYRDLVKAGRGVEEWDELRGGILLGSDDFVDKLKPLLSDYEVLKEVPRRERLTARPSLAKLFAKVPNKETRNERIHDALRVHGYALQEVGDAAGLHYSTVSRIASRVASKSEQPRR